MKTINLSVPDEAAEAFENLSNEEKVKMAFFIEAFTRPMSEEAFAKTLRTMAQEARANGMTEQEIEIFLNSLS
jgi:hypothetical protein